MTPQPNSGRKYWTKEQILKSIAAHKSPVKKSDIETSNGELPTYATVLREFGSLEAANKAAGFPGHGRRGRPRTR